MVDSLRNAIFRHFVTFPLVLRQETPGVWKPKRALVKFMAAGRGDDGKKVGWNTSLTETVTSLISKARFDNAGVTRITGLGFQAVGPIYRAATATADGTDLVVPLPSSTDLVLSMDVVQNLRDRHLSNFGAFGILRYKEREESKCETFIGPAGFAPAGIGTYNADKQATISLPSAGAMDRMNVDHLGAVIDNSEEHTDRIGFYLDLAALPSLDDGTPSDGHIDVGVTLVIPMVATIETQMDDASALPAASYSKAA